MIAVISGSSGSDPVGSKEKSKNHEGDYLMDSSTIRMVVTIVLFIHAIGHVQGVLAALGLFNSEIWHPRSWLLDKLIGEKGSRTVALIIWLTCVLGFLATAFSFLDIGIPFALWRPLAIIFSIISIFGLIFYWNSFAAIFNKIGALAVNGAILVGLLFLDWPTDGDLGF
jgi:hypothetical protein